MRIVPYMPLSISTTMIGRPYCTAVANSCPFIRKSPSPAKQTTVRFGNRRCAPIAAGRPKPIEPDVEPSCCSTARKRKKRPTQIAKFPAPLVKIPSGDRRRIRRGLFAPGQIILARDARLSRPADLRRRLNAFQRGAELRSRSDDAENRMVVATDLRGVRVDMHQPLRWSGN